ncbi:hypothetical protein GMORB2_2056 [Geosmithia morbida]|uniref:Uncharacterized protein n=1 Tax=Geosmithia morbida TaxID=1094350 RepID=A0A9P4YTY9_9HYPO|nr:uncharacterized protein GMORB2_2056 [Geosmithia morbida]KAF4121648.1 hypothetical protein GMORB2_2056 [Geosmithia morbida]
MNPSEKRRGGGGGGGGGGGRTSSSQPHTTTTTTKQSNASTATSSKRRDSIRANKDRDQQNKEGEAAGRLPTLPPRAAVSSATPEDQSGPPDGGVTLPAEREDALGTSSNHTRSRDSQKQQQRDRSRGGGSRTRPTPRQKPSSSPSSSSNDDKQQQQQQQGDMDKIAELKREMAAMERDFNQRLDRLSQSESETAAFWQAKHSALHQQFLRADTEVRLLRSEVETRAAERDELRRGWDVLRRQLQERDDEARRLRSQVRGLKEFVSTSTRTHGQATDEDVVRGMARLANGLQNWVITNFRRARLSTKTAGNDVDDAELLDLAPTLFLQERGAGGQAPSKVHLLQSVASRILVDMVFNAYYVGLSDDQTAQFNDMEKLLLSFGTWPRSLCTLFLPLTFFPSLFPPSSLDSSTTCMYANLRVMENLHHKKAGDQEPVNQWRSSTLALIRREAPQRLSDETAAFAEKVASRINRIMDSITTANSSSSSSITTATTTTSPETPRDSSLRALVSTAIDLARLLAVQKAVLRVYFPPVLPHQRIPFDTDTMEDIGGGGEEDEADDALVGREVRCVAFPGIIKYGDETGGHLHFRNVICKARVLCKSDD